MPTRISAGVGDHPCSLLLIYIIPITVKLRIFCYTCIYFIIALVSLEISSDFISAPFHQVK